MTQNQVSTFISRLYKGFTAFLMLTLFSVLSFAQDSANGLVYHGRVLKPNGDALEDANVNFTVRVYGSEASPVAKRCLLYEETHSGVNMTGSLGTFELKIGEGTRTFTPPQIGAGGIGRLFLNSPSFTLTTTSCTAGTNDFTAESLDADRELEVTIQSGATVLNLPAQKLRAMPWAMQAMEIGGYSADYLAKLNAAVPSQMNAGALMYLSNNAVVNDNGTPTNYSDDTVRLQNLINPTNPQDAATKNYVDTAVGSGYSAGNGIDITTGVIATRVDNATIEFDGSGIMRVKALGIGTSHLADGAITAVKLNQMGAASGEVLKWNGSAWAPAADDDSATVYTAGDGLALTGSDFAVNVDNVGVEINSDTLRLKDGGISFAKLNSSGATVNDGMIVSDSSGRLFKLQCAGNQVANWSMSNGWECINPSSLAGVQSNTLATNNMWIGNGSNVAAAVALPTCAANQYITYNGAAWTCAMDVGSGGSVSSAQGTAAVKVNGDNAAHTGAITISVDDATAASKGLVQVGSGLSVTSGTASVAVDNSTLEVSGGNVQVKDAGITRAKLAAGSANGDILKWDGDSWELAADVDTGTVISGGTQNYLTKFNAAGDNVVNSAVYENAGKVGIGTATPSHQLSVEGSSNDWTAGSLYLRNTNAGANAITALVLGNNNLLDAAALSVGPGWTARATLTGDHGLDLVSKGAGKDIRFMAGGTSAEKMRIESTGNVGIGTTAPNEKLTVDGVVSLKESANPTASAGYGKIFVKPDNTVWYMDEAGTPSQFVFGTGAGEVNTGSSLGGTADVFKQKSGVDLQFRGLTGSTAVTVTENATDIGLDLADGGIARTKLAAGSAPGQILKWDGDSWELASDDNTTYTAGDALSLTAGDFDVKVDGSTIEVNGSNQLQVKDGGITLAKINSSAYNTGEVASTLVMRDSSSNIEGSGILGDALIMKGSTSGQVTLQAPVSPTSYALTFPSAQGSANQVLSNNGSGVLSWSAPNPVGSSLNQHQIWLGNVSNLAAAVTLPNCGANQVLKYDNASGFTCQNDAGASGTVADIASTAPVKVNGVTSAQTGSVNISVDDATTGSKGIMQVGTGLGVSSGTVSVTYGTTAGTAAQGNDARLSDARTPVGTALNSANIWVGNVGNTAAAVNPSGDVDIDNAGVFSITADSIVNADINATANIDASKLGTGVVSNTEFNYLDGVTSAVQTQLDAKVANGGGTPSITTGTFALRPGFGTAGRIYIASDTNAIYRDTGAAWVLIGDGAGTGDVTDVTVTAPLAVTNSSGPNPNVSITAGSATGDILQWTGAAWANNTVATCAGGQYLTFNGTTWACSAPAGTTYTGGDGLTLTGNDFDVNVDDSTIEISADTLKVKDGGIGFAKLNSAGGTVNEGLLVKDSSGRIFPLQCAGNQVPVWSVANGWECINPASLAGVGTTTISGGTQNYLAKFNAAGDNVVNSTIYESGGSVGIGTSSLNAKLDVVNTGGGVTGRLEGAAAAWLQFNEVDSAKVWNLIGDGGNFDLREDGTANARLRIRPGGNIGIGPNVNANTVLDVDGAVSIRGLAAAPANAPTDQARFYYDTVTDKMMMSINSTGYQELATVSGIGGSYVAKAGDTMTGPLVNNSNSASAALAVTQSGAGHAATFMGGNVGIGNTTPAATLSLGANSNSLLSDGTSSVSAGGINFSLSNQNNQYVMGLKNAASGANHSHGLLVQSGAGNYDDFIIRAQNNASGDVLSVLSSSKVGIGTAAPAALLAVGANSSTLATDGTATVGVNGVNISPANQNSKYVIGIKNPNSGASAGHGLLIQAGNASYSNNYVIRAQDATGGTELFTVRSDGKVGIGTAAPIASLSVGDASNVAVSDGTNSTWVGGFNLTTSANIPDNTYLATMATVAGDRAHGLLVKSGKAGETQFVLRLQDSSGNDMMSVQANGKVGIGAISPATAFGVGSLSGTLIDDGTNGVTSNGINANIAGVANGKYLMGLQADTGYAQGLLVRAGRSDQDSQSLLKLQTIYPTVKDQFVVKGSGKIGLGTDSPTAKLHLPAGTTAAGTSPLKFEPTSATLMTTPENGAMEFDGTDYYLTAGGTRNKILTNTTSGSGISGSGTTGTIPRFTASSTLGDSILQVDTNGTLNIVATMPKLQFNGINYLHTGNGTAPGYDGNTFVGQASGNATLTGANNNSLGYVALMSLTTGNYNVALGSQAMRYTTSGTSNVAVGSFSLQSTNTGSQNVGLGDSAGSGNTSGAGNVAIGYEALDTKTTGDDNVAVGRAALGTLGAGGTNVALGSSAGGTANGASAGNVFIGYSSGPTGAATISNRLYIDNSANNTPLIGGDFSTDTVEINGGLTVGPAASAVDKIVTITGQQDAAIKLVADTDNAVSEGHNPYIEMSQDNLGTYYIMGVTGTAGTTPNETALTGTLGNTLFLGTNNVAGNIQFATGGSGGATYGVRMTILDNGNVGIGNNAPGEALEVNGNVKGTSFISTSDRRLKKNIRPIAGMSAINQLRGVQYEWRSDDVSDAGVIAQEVEQVFPNAVRTDAVTGFKAVKYNYLIAPLIEATKENYKMCKQSEEQIQQIQRSIASIQAKDSAQDKELQALRKENAQLKQRLDLIEKKLGIK